MLGSGCINFTKENHDRGVKLALRSIAFILVAINLSMALALFPMIGLLTFFTNWAMHFSLLTNLLVSYFGSIADIHLHKGKLVALHIVYEFAVISNVTVVLMYWGVIHNEVIHNFEGYIKLHMYIVHIFPALGLFLTQKSTDMYLCTSHWILFVPVGIIYNIINYYATLQRGKPLYWFLTWEDYTSVFIVIGMQVAFSLIWIGLAKISQINVSSDPKVQSEKSK